MSHTPTDMSKWCTGSSCKLCQKLLRLAHKSEISDVPAGFFSKPRRRDKLLFASIGRESSFEIGHRLEDLIVHCKFKGNDKCLHNETNLKLFQSSELFNCYAFFPYRLKSENDELSLILYKESSIDQQIKGFTDPLYRRVD